MDTDDCDNVHIVPDPHDTNSINETGTKGVK